MKTITLELLAEKLNGNLWQKGDLKRVYIDAGYNTKKMSTKTYVFQNEAGEFVVVCKVDCPSQPYQWCKSQEDSIKESVSERIENIIAQSTLELVDFKLLEEKNETEVFIKRNADAEPVWLHEEKFYEEFGNYPGDVFGGKLEEEQVAMYARNRKLREEAYAKEQAGKAAQQPQDHTTADVLPSRVKKEKVKKEVTPAIAVSTRVKHSKFGFGIVTSAEAETMEVLFDEATIGSKKFVNKYVTLEIVQP